MPLGGVSAAVRSRQSLELTVRPTEPDLVAVAMDEARVALRVERRLRPKQPDNFGVLSSETFLDIYSRRRRASLPS